jgi:methylated-DNA-[protein]-cysteine S-methyltransferase
MRALSLESPIGPLTVFEENGQINRIVWGGKSVGEPSQLLVSVKRQIADYFAGKRRHFDAPLKPAGSELELKVWRTMSDIPYGATDTYGEIAKRLDTNARLVGQACGRNPIPILQPCHRVVAARGLGGFSAPGGVEWKQKLLVLERALLL